MYKLQILYYEIKIKNNANNELLITLSIIYCASDGGRSSIFRT